MTTAAPAAPPQAEALWHGQPRGVWAVLGACIVAFMGIGLVDPILPVIAKGLHANNSQVELLFTSYFVIIGVSNLLAGFVTTRIGAKRTLLWGLAAVVVCSAAAGLSNSVDTVVAFRAGWGLGIALFASTAMTIIVTSAVGGTARAVILFESALGIGIASGPLLGGVLGGISWRVPFYGVAVLMAIGFISIATQVRPTAPPPAAERISLGAPLRALSHGGLLAGGIVALLYNFGFFTLLAYTPLPLGLGVHELGLVFFGWGVLVALGAIFLAPRLSRRYSPVSLLIAIMGLIAVDELVIGVGIDSKATMIAAIVASGLVLGTGNALLSTVLMNVSHEDAAVGASAMNFIRFFGGALAPFLAGKLSEHVSVAAPLYMGAAVVVAGGVALVVSRRLLDAPAPEPTALGVHDVEVLEELEFAA